MIPYGYEQYKIFPEGGNEGMKEMFSKKNGAAIVRSKVKWLLFLLAVFCICGSNTKAAFASSPLNAQEIALNRDVYDNVSRGYNSQQNYYRFSAMQSGKLEIMFSTSSKQATAGEYWKVSLYNSYYDELCTEIIYGDTVRTYLPAIGIAPGIHYIRVTSAAEAEAKSTDFYTLRTNFTASAYWEKEPNDTYVNASPIGFNTEYFGTMRGGPDVERDFYRLTVTQPGYLDITFSNALQKDGEAYWKIFLYSPSYKEICNKIVYGNQRYTRLASTGVDAGVYYVMITSAVWSGVASKDVYTIRADFRESDIWEKEPNDDFSTATEIKLNTVYNGTTSGGEDYEKDYYKFYVTAEGKYRIQVKPSILWDSAAYWRLYVYDPVYNELARTDIFGSQTPQYIDKELRAGTNYIKIASAYWNESRTMDAYQVSVTKLDSSGQPEMPVQPTTPSMPTQPGTPMQPTAPIQPTTPSTPAQPSTPMQPTAPAQPSTPEDNFYDIEWNVSSAALQAGQSTNALTAEVTGDDEIDFYTTSNLAVVTIDSSGVITAKKAGTAVIKAVTKRGCTAELKIKVQKKAVVTKNILVDTKNVSLQEGGTFELEAETVPVTSSDRIRYTSVNSTVASVNRYGVITAKKKGTTTIKVKSGKITVKVKVTIQ